MHSSHLLLEEPIRMASILKPSKSLKGREIEYDFLELNSPVPLYNCDQQGCFDSVARIGSLVLTVTQEAFWKLGKRLLSSLNDLMGIPGKPAQAFCLLFSYLSDPKLIFSTDGAS
ncbi:hypothetical protein YC2023_053140 [Brassica napus]